MSKRPVEEEAFPRRTLKDQSLQRALSNKAPSAGKPQAQIPTEGSEVKRRRKDEAREEDDELTAADLEGARPVKLVCRMRDNQYVDGMLLIAAVRDCTDEELAVNLPYNRVGFVSRTQAMEPESATGPLPSLSDLFQPGQLVIAVVTAVLEGEGHFKTRIELSLRPALVNAGLETGSVVPNMFLPAVVQDEQEHVFRLGFGIHDMQGVLKKTEAAELPFSLCPGLIVPVAVQAVSAKGTLKCSLKQAEPLDNAPISLEMLKAGFLVHARVKTVLSGDAEVSRKKDAGKVEAPSGAGGLCVKFCDSLEGVVHHHHMGDAAEGEEAAPSKNDLVPARVLAVVPGKHISRVHLTLLPHILEWTSRAEELAKAAPVAARMQGEAVDCIRGYGCRMLCSPADAVEGQGASRLVGFCPIGRMADEKEQALNEVLSPGATTECRVLAYNFLEASLVLTRRPQDLLEHSLVSVFELTPGQLVTGTITRVADYGVFVKLSEYVTGLVSLRHLTDVPLPSVPSRFQVGGKLKCRVLRLMREKRRVDLTAKKSLLKGDFQLCSLEQARKDMLVTGFVTNIQAYGLLVTFFNSVYGLIPSRELEIHEAPAMGMAVRVKILHVSRKRRQLLLSLDLEGGKTPAELGAAGNEEGTGPAHGVLPGHLATNVHALQCNDGGVLVSWSAKALAREEPLKGYIPLGHLADDQGLAKARHAALVAALADGKAEVALPEEGVVLHRRCGLKGLKDLVPEPDGHMLLSLKPSMRLAVDAEAFVTKFEQLQESRLYAGYVREVHDFGAFVNVGAWRYSGITGRSLLTDQLVESPATVLTPGQTVRVRVSKLDPEKQRFRADVQPRLAPPEEAALLRREAEALRLLFQAKAALVRPEGSGAALVPGSVVDAEVTSLDESGARLSLGRDQDLTGAVLKENIPDGTKLSKGDKLQCAVLDFDPEAGVVDVSLQTELVAVAGKATGSRAGKKQKAAAASQALTEGQELLALPALQKPAYSVLWAKEPPTVLFTAPWGQRRWDAPRAVVVHSTQAVGPGGCRCLLAQCPVGDEAERRLQPRVPRILRPEEELKVGNPVRMRVRSVKGFQVYCAAPGHVDGHVHVTQMVEPGPLGSGGEEPLETLKKQRMVEARILAVRQHGTSSTRGKIWHTELTLRPSLMKACDEECYKSALVRWSALQIGQLLPAVVKHVKESFILMEINSKVTGRVSLMDASVDRAVLKDLNTHFKKGQVYSVEVLRTSRIAKKHLDLSMIESGEGSVVMAQLDKVENAIGKGIAASFRLPNHRRGFVHISELFDFWLPFPQQKLKPKDFYEVKVLRESVEEVDGKAELSLRASLVYGRKEGPGERRPTKIQDLEVGQKVCGYVVNSGPKGVFVELSRSQVGRIRPKLIKQEAVALDAIAGMYPVGELIRDALVVSISAETGRVELSMRPGDASSGLLTREQLSVGDTVSGVVKAIQKYGFFMHIDNSRVDGLVHHTEISDTPSVSLQSYTVGMRVPHAKVLKIEGNKVALSTKLSNFNNEELEDDLSDDDEDEDEEVVKMAPTLDASKSDVRTGVGGGGEAAALLKEFGGEGSAEVEAAEEPATRGKKRKAPEPAAPAPAEQHEDVPWKLAAMDALDSLGNTTGFEFADFKVATTPTESEEEQDEQEDAEPEKKLSKRAKRAREKAEAKEVQQKEAEVAEKPWQTDPRSVEDFERLLLSQGDTSIIWIRYMAFHLKMSDLERARQVAERAVKHVGFSDVKERFNTWVAFMNLECTFGTEETADAVFKRACSHNTAKHVYLQLARIHERNKKVDLATRTYEACCRKFGHSKKAWLAFLSFLYRQGDLEGGRKTLPKCLAALPRRKHALVVSKTALLEYHQGSAERGRSIFEGLLDSYPKRTDLWSVYIDAHIGAHTPPKVAEPDLRAVRSMMERCCTMRLKAVKMRFFFKRWLDFEKRWGDVESQEHVRAKARAFVEGQAA